MSSKKNVDKKKEKNEDLKKKSKKEKEIKKKNFPFHLNQKISNK